MKSRQDVQRLCSQWLLFNCNWFSRLEFSLPKHKNRNAYQIRYKLTHNHSGRCQEKKDHSKYDFVPFCGTYNAAYQEERTKCETSTVYFCSNSVWLQREKHKNMWKHKKYAFAHTYLKFLRYIFFLIIILFPVIKIKFFIVLLVIHSYWLLCCSLR